MKRWFLRIVLTLVLAIVVVGFWKREEITRLMAVNSLFAEEKIVSNFSNMDDLFLNRPMSRGTGAVSPLSAGPAAMLPGGFDDWIVSRSMTAVVVLHDGQLVHESYYKGTDPDDLRIAVVWFRKAGFLRYLAFCWMEGAIGGIDEPVTQYAPTLIGSAL